MSLTENVLQFMPRGRVRVAPGSDSSVEWRHRLAHPQSGAPVSLDGSLTALMYNTCALVGNGGVLLYHE